MSMMRCEKHGPWDSDMMTYCPGCEPDCQYCDDTDPLCPVKLQNAAKPASSDLIAPDLVARLNDMLLIGLSNVTMAFAAQLIREAAAALRTMKQEREAAKGTARRWIERSRRIEAERDKLAERVAELERNCGHENCFGWDIPGHRRWVTQEAIDKAEAALAAANALLRELLRLYDWRFELAELEKKAGTPEEVSRLRSLLRVYGEEKKAAWAAARAHLSQDDK